MKTPRHFQNLRAVCAVLTALLLAAAWPARAQSGVGDVVYTVGTVTRDSHGQDWGYILWQATQPDLISNRVFAIYSKPGDPTNGVSYKIQSLVTLQTDARVIEPLIRRAENLGDDLNKLDQDLHQLFANFIPAGSISRAEELSAVMRGSLSDPRFYQNLLLLARNHAAIDMALGFSDAEVIPAGRTTFEVRAYDPSQQKDLAVIGRVTLEAGNPIILPAPGPPVLVPETSAMGDLNVRVRWGSPDNLRRLGLIQFGYDLYRVSLATAVSNGWNSVILPPVTVLTNLAHTTPWLVRRVNSVPITPGKLFTLVEAANLTPPIGDTNTMFIMDDDGRGRPGYVNYGFTNGAEYFYYVAARDVLGRDGALSTGLLATVCDRLPPLPPTHVHVINDYGYDPGTKTSSQALRVRWTQNPNTNDTVTNYWIYRWTNLVDMNALSGDPSNNLVAIVPHLANTTENSFLDDGSGSPSALAAYGETFWYTVRAGDSGACGQNLSGAGGPAFGVLRQRVGPAPGTGAIQINCLQAFVRYRDTTYPKITDTNLDAANFNVFLRCTRADTRFEWAEFYGIITYTLLGAGPPIVTSVTNHFGELYYLGAPAVSAWWTPPRIPSGGQGQYTVTMQIWCRAALFNGKISDFAIASPAPPGNGVYADAEFEALTKSIPTIVGSVTANEPCRVHDPGGGGGGTSGTNNIVVYVTPSAGSKEYRIYRRVDSGPLSLMCQGPITNILSIIQCFEDAPPVNGGTICFFVQLLDENGNPSPMTPIGCVDTAPSTPLPVPVLAKITPLGVQSSPGLTLSWFCAPYGVDRFEVRVAGLPTHPDTNTFGFSSILGSLGAPPATMAFSINGTNLTLPFYSYLTPKVGPGFGNNGAQFPVPCTVELGKTYFVTVRALDKNNNPGEFSDFRSFLWTPTNPVSPQVPWPARGLPSTNANFTAALAFYLSPTNTASVLQWDAPSGIGVLVGFGALGSKEISVRQGPPRIFGVYDPNSALETNQFGDSIFPCAMYRSQVPNANFPKTSGDAIQVTPLMENIAYQVVTSPAGGSSTIIHDPFMGATVTSSASGQVLWLWLRDTQPQISGARYQYTLVRFKSNHEIDQLIPANEVDVP